MNNDGGTFREPLRLVSGPIRKEPIESGQAPQIFLNETVDSYYKSGLGKVHFDDTKL